MNRPDQKFAGDEPMWYRKHSSGKMWPGLHRRLRPLWRLGAALLAVGLLALLAWLERPAHQIRRVLTDIASRDFERLQYRRLSLIGRRQYESYNMLLAGALKLEQGDPAAALRELRYADGLVETRPVALLLTGEALYAQRRFRDAEACFQNALQLDPELVDAHRWLAIAYYDIGLSHEAAWHFQRVAELAPSDPRPNRILAVIHMDLGSHAIAVEDFEESLRRDPRQIDRQEILMELAQSQAALKRFADAERTLFVCEQTAEVLAMRADRAHARGDAAEARRLAQSAIRLEPQQRLALLVLGRLAFDDRDFEGAIAILSPAVNSTPEDYDLRYALLTALRSAGHRREAEEELNAVEELRKLKENFEELLVQARDQPYDADIRYRLGLTAEQLGMPRAADSWFAAAVALDPKHRLARDELNKRGAVSPSATAMLREG